MRIVTVPCLSDNYAYLVVDDKRQCAAVVDPSEAAPVVDALDQEGLSLAEIWCTHHHWDHTGGIEELCDQLGTVPVRGSDYDLENQRIPLQTVGLADDEHFRFGSEEVRILSIPGHTLGAIAYLIQQDLFSGDTLFLAGCGRVFEGTMQMMSESLAKLRLLPADTKVWCGHEYTVNNLRFAKVVEPNNEAIDRELSAASEKRDSGVFTVPGLLSVELEVNPFLRFDAPALRGERSAVDSFAALREQKDNF